MTLARRVEHLHAAVCSCFGHDRPAAAGECPIRQRLAEAICPDPTLHAVADAPLRPLSDLLRTATEFDEIADTVLAHADLTTRDAIDALRAAVRALQGPPAPFWPQQAHAAPAKCNAACFEHPAKGGEA